MSATDTDRMTTATFDEPERVELLEALRLEIRHQDRNRRQLVRKYGAKAKVSRGERKIELLCSAYRKLGGDPEQITNRS